MSNAFYRVPATVTEPVKGYIKGSPEREELLNTYKSMYNSTIDVPMYIGDKLVKSDNKIPMSPPHDHQHTLGHFNMGTKQHVKDAIDAALSAKTEWANLAWEQRAAIFLRAADLLAGPFRA